MTSPFVLSGSASCSSFAVQNAMPLFNVFVVYESFRVVSVSLR